MRMRTFFGKDRIVLNKAQQSHGPSDAFLNERKQLNAHAQYTNVMYKKKFGDILWVGMQ